MAITKPLSKIFYTVISIFAFISFAQAQSTGFTYQGRLTDNNLAANGNYSMQFELFDDVSGGNQIGATVSYANVQVSNGIFTVSLDFGAAAFTGNGRFLQISVFSMSTSSFVVLNPRQPITSAPYAIRSLHSATAENANNLGGIAAAQYILSNDSRLSDARDPLPGSASYIQNSAVQQPLSNFNISGDGTAGGTLSGSVVNAVTQYNLANSRVLSAGGTNNLFVGVATGNTGSNNTFVGRFTGFDNTTGSQNSFLGSFAGANNTSGNQNAFFGSGTGDVNTTGSQNSFFGASAGTNNITGGSNSFFGQAAGSSNTSGQGNAFFGKDAGSENTFGSLNTFIGRAAGAANISGTTNTFVGYNTGAGNTTGSNNTLLGAGANLGADNLSNATAIGAGATVSSSNSVVIGKSNSTTYFQGDVVIGEEFATRQLTIRGSLVTDDVNTDLALQGTTQVCRNNLGDLAFCSSSLRYKTNIAAFSPGLDLVKKLTPITFDWRTGGRRDVGFGAEDVAAIEPLFVTYNNDGQVEGVKYDRISTALVNAVKEQQAEIEALRSQIETLKAAVCAQLSSASVCKK